MASLSSYAPQSNSVGLVQGGSMSAFPGAMQAIAANNIRTRLALAQMAAEEKARRDAAMQNAFGQALALRESTQERALRERLTMGQLAQQAAIEQARRAQDAEQFGQNMGLQREELGMRRSEMANTTDYRNRSLEEQSRANRAGEMNSAASLASQMAIARMREQGDAERANRAFDYTANRDASRDAFDQQKLLQDRELTQQELATRYAMGVMNANMREDKSPDISAFEQAVSIPVANALENRKVARNQKDLDNRLAGNRAAAAPILQKAWGSLTPQQRASATEDWIMILGGTAEELDKLVGNAAAPPQLPIGSLGQRLLQPTSMPTSMPAVPDRNRDPLFDAIYNRR